MLISLNCVRNCSIGFGVDGYFNLDLDGKNFAPLEFVASASLCLKVLKLPVVPSKDNETFQNLLSSCCQLTISTQILSKLLIHPCLMVKYYAILLCLALFDRFNRIKNAGFINDADLLDEFNVQFHRRIPEFQTIQSVYNVFTNLTASTNHQQLIMTKLFRLIQFYFDHFNGTFMEIKFDPFKYMLEKYDLMTNEILISLLPLLSICPFKVLEKRNGKSVLYLIFNLCRNFPCLF